jgi:hypothetical protein
MHLDKIYAGYLINAANIYASQRGTACNKSETWFEEHLLRLFEQAQAFGVRTQDIAVIASTAIAAVLSKSTDNKEESNQHTPRHLRVVKSA